MLKIGKFKITDELKEKQKQDPAFASEVAKALYAHIVGMWAENASKHFDEMKNGERITAVFPTVCGNIIIDTVADRTQTTISMA